MDSVQAFPHLGAGLSRVGRVLKKIGGGGSL